MISVASQNSRSFLVAIGTKTGGIGASKSVILGGGSLYLLGRTTSIGFAVFLPLFLPEAGASGDSFRALAVGFLVRSSRTRVLGLRGDATAGACLSSIGSGRFCGIVGGGLEFGACEDSNMVRV